MKFELDEILTIIEKVKKTDLESFEYQDTDTKIKIRGRKPAAAVSGIQSPSMSGQMAEIQDFPDVEEKTSGHIIEAPMVGTFYTSPAEDAEPFVQPGDTVKKGQTICIIEAMKLMNEVVSDVDGVIESVLVENESMVEFGQPLVHIRKSN